LSGLSGKYIGPTKVTRLVLRGNKLYWAVSRNENSPDTITIDRQVFTIRFSATHVEHITENLTDPAHRIGFLEIVRLLKVSIILPALPNTQKRVALGQHRNKIYETYIYIERGRIDVVTSFACNKPPYQQRFKLYESYVK